MELLADTWDSRDLPVLREAARGCDTDVNGAGVRLADLAHATDLSVDETFFALRALESAGLIEARWVMPARAARVVRVSAEARRLVGLWPTPESGAARMVAALEAMAENSSDMDTRTRARKVLDALT